MNDDTLNLESKNTETSNVIDYNFIYRAPQSILHITSDFRVESTLPKPNRWHRFWYRVLLGWVWSDK